MKRLILLLLTIFTTSTLTFSQTEATTKDGKKILLYPNGTWVYADSIHFYNIKPAVISKLEIPKTQLNKTIVSHTGYSLSYNETHEQANWVAYELTKEETKSTSKRTDKFLPDPKVNTGTANNNDYVRSDYDRGHLAPAADMGWSLKSMAESFYYSNISPQDPEFNRGIWKQLEELVRIWAVDNESVYVVTAPVLTSGLKTIGKNKVSVPRYFYKVILDYKAPGIKGIGFIIPNQSSYGQLLSYAVSIDSVEKFTGIDFFPLLPDEHEQKIESTLNLKSWIWKSSATSDIKETEKTTTSVQCKGITRAGARCKNNTRNITAYCDHHQGQFNNNESIKAIPSTKSSSVAVQCSGIIKAGNRCKRMTTSINGRCYQH